MKNKKAQIFEIYLVVMTGFMCALVVLLYFIQQGNAPNSLVSPENVFEVRDELEIFELKEKEIVLESLKELGGLNEFEGERFSEKFRETFLSKIYAREDMKEFLLKDFVREKEARGNEANFIDSIYLVNFDEKENKIIFNRSKLEKRIYLKSEGSNKINFPVDFSFDFFGGYTLDIMEGAYLIIYENSFGNGFLLKGRIEDISSYDKIEEVLASNYFGISEIKVGEDFFFYLGADNLKEEHILSIICFSDEGVLFEISSNVFYVYLEVGEERLVDVNEDGYFDVRLKLISYDQEKNVVNIEKNQIYIPIEADLNSFAKYLRDNEGEINSPYFKRMYSEYSFLLKKDSFLDNSEEISEKVSEEENFEGEVVHDAGLEFWEGVYAEKLENPNFIIKDIFDDLPWRRTYNFYDTSNPKGLELYKKGELFNLYGKHYEAPCGAAALHEAFFFLGKNVDIRDIIAQKQGGFVRSFFYIFTNAITHITWPKEIKEISENFGFEVELIKGKDATLETAARKSSEDSVVILRIWWDCDKILGLIPQQHYVVYDTNRAKVFQEHYYTHEKANDDKIYELYVIKNKGVII